MSHGRRLVSIALVAACGPGPTPPVCEPGANRACYDGPSGTEGVGACAAGAQICRADGSGWGDCEGTTVPGDERCDVVGDEDCDGLADVADSPCVCAPGDEATCYDGPSGTRDVGPCQAGVRTCAADGLVWDDACVGQVVPGVEDCATPDDEDCDGVSPACPLTTSCARAFPGARPQAVAIGPAGEVVVAGEASGTFDVGLGATTSARRVAFVTRLDAACAVDWVHVWTSDTGYASGMSVAVDPDGNVAVGGAFSAAVDFGGGPLTATSPGWGTEDDMFLVKLDVDGDLVFAKRFGDDLGDQYLWGLAADADGNLLLTGNLPGTADFGGGSVSGRGFVVKLDPSGAHLWSRGWAGGRGRGVAVDTSGRVFVAGVLESSSDLGGGALVPTGPGAAAYVARFEDDGTHAWSRAVGTNVGFGTPDVVVTSTGDVVLGLGLAGSVDLGGGVLTATGAQDLVVASLTGAGAHRWSARLGNAERQESLAVAALGGGEAAVSGTFRGTLVSGGVTLASAGATDAFTLLVDPAGVALAGRAFGDAAAQAVADVAGADDGTTAAVGTFAGTVDFGLGPVAAAASGSGFVVVNAR